MGLISAIVEGVKSLILYPLRSMLTVRSIVCGISTTILDVIRILIGITRKQWGEWWETDTSHTRMVVTFALTINAMREQDIVCYRE